LDEWSLLGATALTYNGGLLLTTVLSTI